MVQTKNKIKCELNFRTQKWEIMNTDICLYNIFKKKTNVNIIFSTQLASTFEVLALYTWCRFLPCISNSILWEMLLSIWKKREKYDTISIIKLYRNTYENVVAERN